jgi:hypothetical protein
MFRVFQTHATCREETPISALSYFRGYLLVYTGRASIVAAEWECSTIFVEPKTQHQFMARLRILFEIESSFGYASRKPKIWQTGGNDMKSRRFRIALEQW